MIESEGAEARPEAAEETEKVKKGAAAEKTKEKNADVEDEMVPDGAEEVPNAGADTMTIEISLFKRRRQIS